MIDALTNRIAMLEEIIGNHPDSESNKAERVLLEELRAQKVQRDKA